MFLFIWLNTVKILPKPNFIRKAPWNQIFHQTYILWTFFVQVVLGYTFNIMLTKYTAWKVLKYGVFSGPYFPVLGLNTEIWSVSLCIQSKYMKIQTRKTLYLDTFHAVILNLSTIILSQNDLNIRHSWFFLTAQLEEKLCLRTL